MSDTSSKGSIRQPNMGTDPRRKTIDLTPASSSAGNPPAPITIHPSELIAYSQHQNHTRLNLTGGRIIDVKETTAQIDLLVREAAV